MNTVTSIVMASAMAALLVTAPLHADEADFDPAKMLSDLEQQLRMTREQYEKARPEMEKAMQEKSRELKASIDRQVDEGYLQLEAMSKEMSQASERLRKDLEQSLNSEQAQELKAYLEGLDRQAVEDATRKLLDELTVLLALTASQIEELKPVLRDYLDQAGTLLQEFIRDSSRTFAEYRREYEAAADELRDQLNDTLDSMQMEKLDRRLDEIKEKVHDQVFINT